MRFRVAHIVLLLMVYAVVIASNGCTRRPTVCTTTPIDIEEVLADSRDLDKELETVLARLHDVETELAEWQQKVADRESQPAALRAELARLKKEYGLREEVAKETTAPPPPEPEQAILPKTN